MSKNLSNPPTKRAIRVVKSPAKKSEQSIRGLRFKFDDNADDSFVNYEPLIKQNQEDDSSNHKLKVEEKSSDGVSLSDNGLPENLVEILRSEEMLKYVNSLTQEELYVVLKFLDEPYHNETEIISDAKYDIIKDIYDMKYGIYDVVGAAPRAPLSEIIELPYYLSSLDKIKTESQLNRWLKKYNKSNYIIEDKIDGMTLLLVSDVVNNKRINSLYTRGGGTEGMDVTHLLDYVSLPKWLSGDNSRITGNCEHFIKGKIAIRGELVLHRKTFGLIGINYKNPRALVTGVTSSKQSFNGMLAKQMSFYAYRIVEHETVELLIPSDEIRILKNLEFLVPNHITSKSIDLEYLLALYKVRNTQSQYDMDGLVVYNDIYESYPDDGLPNHVIAFKTNGETAVAEVQEVVWDSSKDRKLIPVAIYDPTPLAGAVHRRATAHNARYVQLHGIARGAKIVITRRGDAAPGIVETLVASEEEIVLPDPNIVGEYVWNEKKSNLILLQDNDDVIANRIKHFIRTLGIKGVGLKRIKIMVAAGVSDISTLLSLTPEQFETIPGIGPVLSNKMYQDLHKAITNVSGPKILTASNIFPGVGENRFNTIFDEYPRFMEAKDLDPALIAENLKTIRGFKTLADDVGNNMPEFSAWLEQLPMITVEDPQEKLDNAENPTLAGEVVLPSGFRFKRDMETKIKERGGRSVKSFSGNVTMLVMNNLNAIKGKALEAQKAGIPIISLKNFISQYLEDPQ